MAFVAGAGSIVTLLGAARGAVAIGFYNQILARTSLSLNCPTTWLLSAGHGLPAWGFFMVS